MTRRYLIKQREPAEAQKKNSCQFNLTVPLFNVARRPRPASSLRTIASKPVAPEGRPSQSAHRRRSVRPVKVRPARNLRSERRRIAYHVPFFEESPASPQVDIALPSVSLPERPINALAAHVHSHAGDIPGSDSVHTGPKNSLRRMKSEPGFAERPSAARIGTRTERAQGLHRRARRAPSGTDARFVTTRISTRIGAQAERTRDLSQHASKLEPNGREIWAPTCVNAPPATASPPIRTHRRDLQVSRQTRWQSTASNQNMQ